MACSLKDTYVILILSILKLELIVIFKVFVSLYMCKQCVSGCIYYVYVIHSFMQRPVHPSFGQVKTALDG